MIGWSELIFGSMYCGKSEELIRRLKRVRLAGQSYQLFKPSIDTRHDIHRVTTHENQEVKTKVEKILDLHIESNGNDKEKLIQELTRQLSGAMQAHVVQSSKELHQLVDPATDVIGIDEVQFFDTGLIDVVDKLVEQGKRVIMAGLDMYSSGEPFGIVPHLACKAKYVDKLHAVCVDCGHDAYISYKTDGSTGNQKSTVDVGSVGKYMAHCLQCALHREQLKNS